MKHMIHLSAALLLTWLSACTGGPVVAEKEREPVPAPQKDNAASDSMKSTVSEAEMQYVKALREPDRAKRKELFQAARKALLEEAEKNANYKAHLLLGYMADLGQGMPVDGIQAARHYRIAADGGLTEAKIALAEFWRRNGIFLDEALKQLTGIPGYEENPAVLRSLGAVYYAMYENEKGFQMLKKAYRSKNAAAGIRIDILKILHSSFEKFFKGGNYDAALKELKRAEELEPKNYLTPYLMGMVEFRRGNMAEAEKLFGISWKRNPAIPETYREMALLKARAGRYEEAVDDARTAYAVSGHRPEFERALLEIYILSGRTDDLLAFISRELKARPERTDLRLIRISVLQLKKDYQTVYDDLMILRKEPRLANDPVVQESFANVCAALGKYADAVSSNEAILKQGFRPVPALNLAELYIVTEQFDKAVELLHHPDFSDRKEPVIRCVVPYLEACALLASGKKADAAVQRFRTALPEFLDSKKDPAEWDVSMFRKWLKDAKLPDDVKKQISGLTDEIAAMKAPSSPAKKAGTDQPAPAKKAAAPESKNSSGTAKP